MTRALLAVVTALVLIAGCGGGEDEERTPKQRLEAVLPDYERAVADQDCRGFARFAHSQVRPAGRGPDDPPDAAECRALGSSYTRLMGFEAERTKLFGSAALVEGKLAGQLMALVWVVDVDGEWKQVQATPPGLIPQLESQARAGNRFEQNAAAWVRAMREGNCREVFRLLNTASPFVAERPKDVRGFCGRFREARAKPDRLGYQLARAPAAEPIDLGGTRDFHFFRLDTGGGRSWTVIMNTLPAAVDAAGHAEDSVLDYYRTAPPEGGGQP
jgi:hypothetical protein